MEVVEGGADSTSALQGHHLPLVSGNEKKAVSQFEPMVFQLQSVVSHGWSERFCSELSLDLIVYTYNV